MTLSTESTVSIVRGFIRILVDYWDGGNDWSVIINTVCIPSDGNGALMCYHHENNISK